MGRNLVSEKVYEDEGVIYKVFKGIIEDIQGTKKYFLRARCIND